MRAGVYVVRNPRIYARLSDAGLVTGAGTGVHRNIRLCARHRQGEPPAGPTPAQETLKPLDQKVVELSFSADKDRIVKAWQAIANLAE